MQKVKPLGTSKEANRAACTMKCCQKKGCVAFNYDSKSKSCALSGSSFAQSHPVPGGKTMMTCQRAGAGETVPSMFTELFSVWSISDVTLLYILTELFSV